MAFLDYVCEITADDVKKCRAIINIFVHSIYLYDDHFTLIINASKKPLSIDNIPLDDIETAFEGETGSSEGCSSLDTPRLHFQASAVWSMLFFMFLYIGKRYTCFMLEYRRSWRRTLTTRRVDGFPLSSPRSSPVRTKRATISRAAAFTNPLPTGLNAARRIERSERRAHESRSDFA